MAESTPNHAQTFGQLLRKARQAARISQRALAALVGINHTYLSKLEHGVMLPSADLTERLAEKVGVEPQQFWDAAGNTPREVLLAELTRLREALCWRVVGVDGLPEEGARVLVELGHLEEPVICTTYPGEDAMGAPENIWRTSANDEYYASDTDRWLPVPGDTP